MGGVGELKSNECNRDHMSLLARTEDVAFLLPEGIYRLSVTMRTTPRLADCGNDGRSTSVTIIRLGRNSFDPVEAVEFTTKPLKVQTVLPHTGLYLKQSGNVQIA